MTNELTTKQAELHAYLCSRWWNMPTVREMAEELGNVQVNSIVGHLKALERKGYIERDPASRSRGIKLLIGPDLTGTNIEIAGRTYRLTTTEGNAHAGPQPRS
jgi:SOS-response transcriptional repressor LexA